MHRRLLCSLLLAALLVGCSGTHEPAGIPDPTEAVWLVVSGRTDGNLDHCDCPKLKQGGLPQRAEMIRTMREKHPDLLLVDGGVNADTGTLIRRMKTEITWRAMQTMDYDAVLVSAEDLMMGFPTLKPASEEQGIPFVVANVRLTYATGGLAWQTRRIVRRGGLTFGITGVAAYELSEFTLPFVLEDPEAAVRREVEAMRDRVDVVVVLSDSVAPLVNEQLAQIPGIDVFVAPPEQWEGKADEERGPVVLRFGEEGKALGRLGLDSEEDGGLVFGEAQMLPVRSDAPEDFQVRLMVDGIYRYYLQQPGMESMAQGLLLDRPLESDTSNPYVGYKACIDCHTAEYQQWKSTSHAHAYVTLIQEDAQVDNPCVVCHVTGFGRTDGFHVKVAGDPMANVQCEACHGPGGRHAADPKQDNIRLCSKEVCATCHVEQWTPEFDAKFEDYWRRTSHKPPATPTS